MRKRDERTAEQFHRSAQRWALWGLLWCSVWFVVECWLIWRSRTLAWGLFSAVFAVVFLVCIEIHLRSWRRNRWGTPTMALRRYPSDWPLLGPPAVEPGRAPGGIVIQIYGVPEGDLLVEREFRGDSDNEAIIRSAALDAAMTAERSIVVVTYNGDTGERMFADS